MWRRCQIDRRDFRFGVDRWRWGTAAGISRRPYCPAYVGEESSIHSTSIAPTATSRRSMRHLLLSPSPVRLAPGRHHHNDNYSTACSSPPSPQRSTRAGVKDVDVFDIDVDAVLLVAAFLRGTGQTAGPSAAANPFDDTDTVCGLPLEHVCESGVHRISFTFNIFDLSTIVGKTTPARPNRVTARGYAPKKALARRLCLQHAALLIGDDGVSVASLPPQPLGPTPWAVAQGAVAGLRLLPSDGDDDGGPNNDNSSTHRHAQPHRHHAQPHSDPNRRSGSRHDGSSLSARPRWDGGGGGSGRNSGGDESMSAVEASSDVAAEQSAWARYVQESADNARASALMQRERLGLQRLRLLRDGVDFVGRHGGHFGPRGTGADAILAPNVLADRVGFVAAPSIEENIVRLCAVDSLLASTCAPSAPRSARGAWQQLQQQYESQFRFLRSVAAHRGGHSSGGSEADDAAAFVRGDVACRAMLEFFQQGGSSAATLLKARLQWFSPAHGLRLVALELPAVRCRLRAVGVGESKTDALDLMASHALALLALYVPAFPRGVGPVPRPSSSRASPETSAAACPSDRTSATESPREGQNDGLPTPWGSTSSAQIVAVDGEASGGGIVPPAPIGRLGADLAASPNKEPTPSHQPSSSITAPTDGGDATPAPQRRNETPPMAPRRIPSAPHSVYGWAPVRKRQAVELYAWLLSVRSSPSVVDDGHSDGGGHGSVQSRTTAPVPELQLSHSDAPGLSPRRRISVCSLSCGDIRAAEEGHSVEQAEARAFESVFDGLMVGDDRFPALTEGVLARHVNCFLALTTVVDLSMSAAQRAAIAALDKEFPTEQALAQEASARDVEDVHRAVPTATIVAATAPPNAAATPQPGGLVGVVSDDGNVSEAVALLTSTVKLDGSETARPVDSTVATVPSGGALPPPTPPPTPLIIDRRITAAMSATLQQHQRRLDVNPQYVAKYAQSRRNLPIFGVRDEFLTLLHSHPVVIICGTTGCGKTTQIPQFIFEHDVANGTGPACAMVVTQPRRLNAVTIAQRIAAERLEPVGQTVGYSVRLDSKPGRHVNLCTTGIVLQLLTTDPDLRGLRYLIVDEIHERDTNVDLIILLARKILQKRQDFRLILMSATLHSDSLARYFGGAPVLHVDGRLHAVKEHYLDDILETFRHRPTMAMQKSLSSYGGRQGGMWYRGMDIPSFDFELFAALVWRVAAQLMQDGGKHNHHRDGHATAIASSSTMLGDVGSSASAILSILAFFPGWGHLTKAKRAILEYRGGGGAGGPLHSGMFRVILLHSTIDPRLQLEAFAPAPTGCIKVVLATNVAESGVTIDDVGAVIDSGLVKQMVTTLKVSPQSSDGDMSGGAHYVEHQPVGDDAAKKNDGGGGGGVDGDGDERSANGALPSAQAAFDRLVSNVSAVHVSNRMVLQYVARSNAQQRAGRAGRVRPGVCYRLFTRHTYQSMAAFATPEITRQPLDDVILKLLAMGFADPWAVLQEALDPPSRTLYDYGVSRLLCIGAIALCPRVTSRALSPPATAAAQAAENTNGVNEAGSEAMSSPSLSSTTSSVLRGFGIQITPLGRFLTRLPTSPHRAKTILLGALLQCLDSVLTLTAANEVGPFVTALDQKNAVRRSKMALSCDTMSDQLTTVNAFNVAAAETTMLAPRGAGQGLVQAWGQTAPMQILPAHRVSPSTTAAQLASAREALRMVIDQNRLHAKNLFTISAYKRQFFEILCASGFLGREAKMIARERRAPRASGEDSSLLFVDASPWSCNADNAAIVKSVLCAGQFPHVAVAQPDNVSGLKSAFKAKRVTFVTKQRPTITASTESVVRTVFRDASKQERRRLREQRRSGRNPSSSSSNHRNRWLLNDSEESDASPPTVKSGKVVENEDWDEDEDDGDGDDAATATSNDSERDRDVRLDSALPSPTAPEVRFGSPYFVYDQIMNFTGEDVLMDLSQTSMWAVVLLGATDASISYHPELNLCVVDGWLLCRVTPPNMAAIGTLKRLIVRAIGERFLHPDAPDSDARLDRLRAVLKELLTQRTSALDLSHGAALAASEGANGQKSEGVGNDADEGEGGRNPIRVVTLSERGRTVNPHDHRREFSPIYQRQEGGFGGRATAHHHVHYRRCDASRHRDDGGHRNAPQHRHGPAHPRGGGSSHQYQHRHDDREDGRGTAGGRYDTDSVVDGYRGGGGNHHHHHHVGRGGDDATHTDRRAADGGDDAAIEVDDDGDDDTVGV